MSTLVQRKGAKAENSSQAPSPTSSAQKSDRSA